MMRLFLLVVFGVVCLAPGKSCARTLKIREEILFDGETQNEKNRRDLLQANNNKHGQKPACCPQDGIGSIYGALIFGISRNPSLKDELEKAAIFGAAAVLADDDPGRISEKAAILWSEKMQVEDIVNPSESDDGDDGDDTT